MSETSPQSGAPAAGSAWPSDLEPEWQRAFAWIEREVGGAIVAAERQPRWRPAWFLDLVRSGQTLPLYFRGDRGAADHGVYPLEHEMAVLQVLERHEIPVPHVYGFCPEPRGIVMARSPGRANLATAESDAERRAVLDEYVDVLARMHRIDPAHFEAVGLARPATPEALGLGDFDHWERSFRRFKCRPEPLIEFGIRWVRRNVPRGRSRAALIHCDAGQFVFEKGHLSALLDFELAYLGDPAADFAGMLCRDLSEPLGDLTRALRRYEAQTGEALDRAAIDYHFVRFALCTPMVVAHLCAQPPPDVDFVQYLAWNLVYARAPLEVIAKRIGVELGPVALPPPRATRHTPASGALLRGLESAARSAGTYQAYQIGMAQRVAQYLERVDLYGPAVEAQELDEAAALLGARPAGPLEADAALEALVQASGPERDAELTRYFQRRCRRQELLLEPAMRELERAAVQQLA